MIGIIAFLSIIVWESMITDEEFRNSPIGLLLFLGTFVMITIGINMIQTKDHIENTLGNTIHFGIMSGAMAAISENMSQISINSKNQK
jgi:hypothetical protein